MTPPVSFQRRRVNLRTLCPKCKQLQDRFNAATNDIGNTSGRQSEKSEVLHDLDQAQNKRNHVLQKFVEHLKTHTRIRV